MGSFGAKQQQQQHLMCLHGPSSIGFAAEQHVQIPCQIVKSSQNQKNIHSKSGFLIWTSEVYHHLMPLYAEWQIYYYLIAKAILHQLVQIG